MSIDSKDGYYGQDFNAGAATHLQHGGGLLGRRRLRADGGDRASTAMPTATAGSSTPANSRSRGRRSNRRTGTWRSARLWCSPRIASPAVPTISRTTATPCGTARAWKVQYQRQRLPEAVHQRAGGVSVPQRRRRAIASTTAIRRSPTGRGTSNLPFLGPKKLIYADGSVTGARRAWWTSRTGKRRHRRATSCSCGRTAIRWTRAPKGTSTTTTSSTPTGQPRPAGDVHHHHRRRHRADCGDAVLEILRTTKITKIIRRLEASCQKLRGFVFFSLRSSASRARSSSGP